VRGKAKTLNFEVERSANDFIAREGREESSSDKKEKKEKGNKSQ